MGYEVFLEFTTYYSKTIADFYFGHIDWKVYVFVGL